MAKFLLDSGDEWQLLSYMAKYDSTLDTLFSALSDPTRRDVMERLGKGTQTVTELAANYDMALPTFTAHLAKLEAAGLIKTRKSGRIRTCEIHPDALNPIDGWLAEQRNIWEARLDRLDDYVLNLMKDRQNGTRPKD